MLLVYYNIPHHSFYQVYKNTLLNNEEVGSINGFGHLLVQMFYISNNKIYNVNSYSDTYEIFDKKNVKKRFLKRLIRFLNKILKKM